MDPVSLEFLTIYRSENVSVWLIINPFWLLGPWGFFLFNIIIFRILFNLLQESWRVKKISAIFYSISDWKFNLTDISSALTRICINISFRCKSDTQHKTNYTTEYKLISKSITYSFWISPFITLHAHITKCRLT